MSVSYIEMKDYSLSYSYMTHTVWAIENLTNFEEEKTKCDKSSILPDQGDGPGDELKLWMMNTRSRID